MDALEGGDRGAAGAGHVEVRARPRSAPTRTCSSLSAVFSRTLARNHSRKWGAASTTPTAEEVGVGVGEVGGDREEAAHRLRLLPEDGEGHGVAVLPAGPHELRRLGERVRLGELVVRVAGQPVGQEVLLDAGERGDALRVAVEAAVAVRQGLPGLEEAVHRDVDVAELAREAGRALGSRT